MEAAVNAANHSRLRVMDEASCAQMTAYSGTKLVVKAACREIWSMSVSAPKNDVIAPGRWKLQVEPSSLVVALSMQVPNIPLSKAYRALL